ncbi:hypothetical protein Tco_0272962 [Tanacetum coccineum]
MILLLRNVTVPPSTGNFNISCAVDGMARIFLIPGLPIISLCWDGDLTTMRKWNALSRSLTKQCSYRISEDAPPSKYIRCMKCPPISASMIIGPSVPSSSPRGGKEIVASEEKLWVTFFLATLSHGWTIRMASGFSFPTFSPFLGAFGMSFCFSSLMNCENLPALIISSIYFLNCMHSSVMWPVSA